MDGDFTNKLLEGGEHLRSIFEEIELTSISKN